MTVPVVSPSGQRQGHLHDGATAVVGVEADREVPAFPAGADQHQVFGGPVDQDLDLVEDGLGAVDTEGDRVPGPATAVGGAGAAAGGDHVRESRVQLRIADDAPDVVR